ncbi:hypothetical protein GUITHDRAFT_109506 [Guillardia theta CCMP2712]|uniref:ApaG domain-containing protein n=1 Tax=Guillardia theta (strain CCMP2712) TaxID=905079 RepID=L1J8S4_GUITC|nr:hypothetical protein GUITHDRAFT_109506 [Guillardia theta CCMP2712]EKX44727.1 hypothetical protein GUITHDRAFT_109506 [Guillardia theta CCMP2712]|eukprot:XP_005831707.1 hypothetical protein GUITHDRAFT_109506 [Guillardia theta CCMP2712]
MAMKDALQLAVLVALFAVTTHIMKSTDKGSDVLGLCRRLLMRMMVPSSASVVVVSDRSRQTQPDEVRQASEFDGMEEKVLKCEDEIPAYSSVTTNGIRIFAESFYHGFFDDEHWWIYRIEFKNVGSQRVQLLSRNLQHWVFVDSNGKTTEVKGPGARGLTPKLSPGKVFKYESRTPILTRQGSMYGSFQFQVIRHETGVEPSNPIMFNAFVGRLALSQENEIVKVPCGKIAGGNMVPLTSVWITDKVIVGVTSYFLEEMALDVGKRKMFRFCLDVQINNGQEESMWLKHVRWRIHYLNGTVSVLDRNGIFAKGKGQTSPEQYQLASAETVLYEDIMDLEHANAFVTGEIFSQAASSEVEEKDGKRGGRVEGMGKQDKTINLRIAPLALNAEGEPIEDKSGRFKIGSSG